MKAQNGNRKPGVVRRHICVLVSAMLLAVCTPARAVEISEQVPTGPRAIGMGGAFSSVADDHSAVFWNPAGLARIGHQEIAGTYADLYGTGIEDGRLAFVLPLAPSHAAALDWYRSGFEDEELDFGENRFTLAYGVNLHSKLSVGGSVKYLTRTTGLDGATVRDGNGVGADLGVLAGPWRGFRFGLVAQDLFDTELHYADGLGTAEAYPRNVRMAGSYTLRDLGTLAVDLDDRIHLGAEVLPVEQVALRGGYQRDLDGDEDATWSVGAGFKVDIFRLDYAYEIHPVLDNTSHFGFSLAFHFNPARVRVERVEAANLYASLHKTYRSEPVAVARVRNLDDEPLDTRLSVFIPGLMESPSEQRVILRPGAVQEVPLPAVFSERVMELDEDRPVQVEVAASYRGARVNRTDRATGHAVVYGRGAVDWSGGVAPAAAFVTQKDPAVDGFARQAGREATLQDQPLLGSSNLALTEAMFDAVEAVDVAYVPDPNNPYVTISEVPHAVDTIQYPRETLAKRAGDCDDTSVLMAALLANVGVPSKFVDVPGHLMILAGTGIHETRALGLAVPEDLYVVDAEQVWIPLETTALGEGFPEAWRKGAEEYRSWSSRGQVRLVDVTAAQARFEPALPPGPGSAPQIDTERLRSTMAAHDAEIASWRNAYLAERFSGVDTETAASASALNEVAQVRFLAGAYESAEANLRRALEQEPASARLHNNLAVVLAARDRIEPAIDHLERAVEADATDAGIWLNLGLVRYAAGETEPARESLSRGLNLGGDDYDRARRLLGLLPEGGPERGDAAALAEQEVRDLLRSALDKVPMPEAPSDTIGTPADSLGAAPDSLAAPVDGTESAEPGGRAPELRVGAARATDMAAIRPHLYWKP